MSDQKPFAASADQNKEPILEVLGYLVQAGETVLELGSGTGQHACFFARNLTDVIWQPTDLRDKLPVIRMWLEDEGVDNIKPPLELDVNEAVWPVDSADVIYTANTLHIISQPAAQHLFAGVGRTLSAKGCFCAYGPFSIAGEHTSPSNAQFDLQLKEQDARSGVRDTVWLDSLAAQNGLAAAELIAMPSNNFIAVWRRAAVH